MPEPILTISNRHTAACGPPPALSNESPALYVGYFENRYFSQDVREVLGTILEQTATDPPVYRVELLCRFKGVKRVEVPADRI